MGLITTTVGDADTIIAAIARMMDCPREDIDRITVSVQRKHEPLYVDFNITIQ